MLSAQQQAASAQLPFLHHFLFAFPMCVILPKKKKGGVGARSNESENLGPTDDISFRMLERALIVDKRLKQAIFTSSTPYTNNVRHRMTTTNHLLIFHFLQWLNFPMPSYGHWKIQGATVIMILTIQRQASCRSISHRMHLKKKSNRKKSLPKFKKLLNHLLKILSRGYPRTNNKEMYKCHELATIM